MSKKIIILQLVVTVFLTLLFGVYIYTWATKNTTLVVAPITATNMMARVNADDAAPIFINPATTANVNKHYIINFKQLKDDLVTVQKKYPQKTYVYFAYLNNSSWIGLNEKEMFTAASTIKVPLAMSIYKLEEEKKLASSDTYNLDELDLDKNFGDLYKVGTGKTLSVEDLIVVMLTQSDNTAMQALFHILKLSGIDDPLADLYNTIGWDYSDFGTNPTYIEINLKTLSNMFVSLYNATYINVENSRRVLEYLSKSPFNDQIVAGVPKSITVAHKIGVNQQNGTYSDCGIVYAVNRPYILCVGSTGAEKKEADDFIKEVSSVVYKYVINN